MNDQNVNTMVARIRSAEIADVQAIVEVHDVGRRAYYQAGGVSVPVDDPAAQDEYHNFWLKMLTVDGNHGWIAEDSAHCVAFLVAGPPVHDDVLGLPALELIGLYARPEAWGSGVADDLHDRFVELLADTPAATEGVLDVWRGNHRAQSFYRRHGWVPDGRSRPGPGGQPFVGLRLALPA